MQKKSVPLLICGTQPIDVELAEHYVEELWKAWIRHWIILVVVWDLTSDMKDTMAITSSIHELSPRIVAVHVPTSTNKLGCLSTED